MKIDTRNLKHWWLLLLQATFTALSILARIFVSKAKKPVVIFYGHQFAGNLKALYIEWQQHFQDDLQVYFLTLDPEQLEHLETMGINVLSCSRLADICKLSHTSVIVTDHGLHAMFPLIRLTNILFVDVWHGIPFKGFIPQDFRLQHQYDEVWVPSERVKALYSQRFGFHPRQLHSLGYARTDKLFRRTGSQPSFREELGICRQRKIVLYAPTWLQTGLESPPTPFGLDNSEFIECLSKVCRAHDALLVNRCHLNTALEEHDLDNVIYVPQKMYPDTEDILLDTDILVCDWSSIALDFAILGRPTLFLDIPPPFKNGLALGKEYRFGMVIDTMDALQRAMGECLDDASHYQMTCADKQSAIVSELYAQESIGQAARLQLKRLIKLTAR